LEAHVPALPLQSQAPHAWAPPAGPALADQARTLSAWMCEQACPLWWAAGADHAGWGFHERLALDGRSLDEPRRARVQARQAYVFAAAGALGWRGPWQAAAEHALDGLFARYRRPDGLFRTLVRPDGGFGADLATLYDNAFVLLALAGAAPWRPQAREDALRLLQAIRAELSHPAGGFLEPGLNPYQSNPHMHLLEAALAWMEIDAASVWRDLAGSLVDLAVTWFIDPRLGFLREHFAWDWTPAEGEAGRLVEPGHQFEWAWLLERWSRMMGDGAAREAAFRLYDAGRQGIDPVRGVAVDELWDDLTVRRSRARLWPQTERLKAALILSEVAWGLDRERLLADASEAGFAIGRYLDVPVRGLWRDKLEADGAFIDEPAPASSFYHIVSAIDQLRRTRAAGRAPVARSVWGV
jgi:mannose-1-phosphate guanylyltransferase/mannose-6-phosphate isomerase